MTDTAVLVEGLRAWAKGMYTTEAAAELLIRACNGRLLRGPWIRTDQAEPGIVWLDTDRAGDAAYLSGGELRVLRIAASLASSQFPVSLSDEIPGLGRGDLELVLAAVAHAGGSHEHSDVRIDAEAGVFENRGQLPSLRPWPVEARTEVQAVTVSRFPREDGEGFDIPLGITDEGMYR